MAVDRFTRGRTVGIIWCSDDHTGRPGAASPTRYSFGVRGAAPAPSAARRAARRTPRATLRTVRRAPRAARRAVRRATRAVRRDPVIYSPPLRFLPSLSSQDRICAFFPSMVLRTFPYRGCAEHLLTVPIEDRDSIVARIGPPSTLKIGRPAIPSSPLPTGPRD